MKLMKLEYTPKNSFLILISKYPEKAMSCYFLSNR